MNKNIVIAVLVLVGAGSLQGAQRLFLGAYGATCGVALYNASQAIQKAPTVAERQKIADAISNPNGNPCFQDLANLRKPKPTMPITTKPYTYETKPIKPYVPMTQAPTKPKGPVAQPLDVQPTDYSQYTL